MQKLPINTLTVLIIITITLLSINEITAKEKTISVKQLYKNFSLASGKTIKASGNVEAILYKGESIRFVLNDNGNAVMIETDNSYFINNTYTGRYFTVCGFFLKVRKMEYSGMTKNLPVLLVNDVNCD